MVHMIVTDAVAILSALLIAGIIIREYKEKTIKVAFVCPINKEKYIMGRLKLIAAASALMNLLYFTFCVGMKVRSTTASLMSSFIMIFVLQLIISQSENAAFELVITLVLTGMMLLTFYILRKSRVIHILPN